MTEQEQTDTDAKPGAKAEATEPEPKRTFSYGSEQPEPEAEAEPQPDGSDEQQAKLRNEAAGYRRRLREAEKQRDEAVEALTSTRRGELERALAEHLADPADLLSADTDVGAFYAEGKLDPAAVQKAASEAVAEHPHWALRQPVDFDGGARESAGEQPVSFGKALKGTAARG